MKSTGMFALQTPTALQRRLSGNCSGRELNADILQQRRALAKRLLKSETDENLSDSRPFPMFTSVNDVKLVVRYYGAGLSAPGGMR